MAEEDDEDPIVQEIDVYLAKSMTKKLYLFQYPIRPAGMTYDDTTVLASRIKPNQKKVELELAVNTSSSNYSYSKGQQIALNVDGSAQGSDSSFFDSDVMNKQVLMSSPFESKTIQYAAGVLHNGELHITPLNGALQMKPSFSYLDRADTKVKQASGVHQDEGELSQEEEEAKPVTVKYARPESDQAKARRMQSYEYITQQKATEPWIDLQYHSYFSSKSKREREQLYCTKTEVDMSEFNVEPRDYLNILAPEQSSDTSEKPDLPSNVLSMTQLRTMPVSEQIKTLLLNAKVIKFVQLMQLLPRDTDEAVALRSLQQVAILVQGCWVVKSEILYPKETFSSHSGVSAEILCRARNYLAWKFTQSRFVTRKEITSVIKLPQDDLKEMLEQMAKIRVHHGWEFLQTYDNDFIHRYPEIVQRQQMLMDGKYQQLCKILKLSKHEGAVDDSAAIVSRRQRRKSHSRSHGTDSESDSAMLSGGETDDRKSSLSVNIGNNVNYNVPNGPGGDTSKDLKTELTSFVQDKLYSRYVLTLSELRRQLALKLGQCPPGHVLGKGVSDALLAETALDVGARQVKYQWSNNSFDEPLYVITKTGDMYDEVRESILTMFQSSSKFRIGQLKKKLVDTIGDTPPESDLRKLLRDYCISKAGYYYLKGTISVDS